MRVLENEGQTRWFLTGFPVQRPCVLAEAFEALPKSGRPRPFRWSVSPGGAQWKRSRLLDWEGQEKEASEGEKNEGHWASACREGCTDCTMNAGRGARS